MNLFEFKFNGTERIIIDIDKLSLVELREGIPEGGNIYLMFNSRDTGIYYDTKEDCEKDYNLLIGKLRGEG